ncbi:MAG: hypothetical protein ACHQT8_01060 [Chlamydiales bacterium]
MSLSFQITPIRIGEPNCMKWAVDLIRSKEESCTPVKVGTYALAFFLGLLACATIVGIYFVCKIVSEYHRQSCEAAAQQASEATVRQLAANVGQLQKEALDRVREQDARIERIKTFSPAEFRKWKNYGALPPSPTSS